MNLRPLIDLISGGAAFDTLIQDLDRAQVAPLQLMRGARSVVSAALFERLRKPIVIVASSVDGSRMYFDALRALCGPDQVMRFAEPNTAFYDTVAPVQDVIAHRSAVLASLVRDIHTQPNQSVQVVKCIITSPRALMQPVWSPHFAQTNSRILAEDQPINLEQQLSHWLNVGYTPDSVVERLGTFSRRGGILDVWSPAMDSPARIELFGDQIDSIRTFDPETQRSGSRLGRILLTPMDSPASRGGTAASARQTSLLNHIGAGLVIVDDEAELADAWHELEQRAERERGVNQISESEVERPYISWQDYATLVASIRCLVLGQGYENSATLGQSAISKSFISPPHFGGQFTPLVNYLEESYKGAKPSSGSRVIVVSRQSARLADIWGQKHPYQSGQSELLADQREVPSFVTAALPGGFEFAQTDAEDSTFNLVVLTDNEIFGFVKPESSSFNRARRAAPERAFSDWQPGDAVVHEDYGVGIFRGLIKLTVNTGTQQLPQEGEREYLLLEYAEANRLYVPLHHVDRINRYVGGDDLQPVLSKLGSGDWQVQRQKAKGAAAEVARELLQVYAERELAVGHSFGPDTAWQHELEASFPFVETDDQLRAIEAVKEDMRRPRPMDRLVCGDVGFGKTEVALRAAFKAVQDGKQVAVLVPTTVLAQQHWTTFSRRLLSYPMKVEMLSRFRTAAEKRKIHDGLREGKIDIVIGTHGLVSESTTFKDLGLLIIDEEQRFGIRDKERLKKLRSSVDVLTLTATPIPRTLYLGLTGIRDISKIETPPVDRLPIISYVGPADDSVIQQAIRRELDRDGQVFIVHNRVQTLGVLQERLSRLVPEATMTVAHGQMEERKLAAAMTAFSEGKFQILLCTNIIESGLDISNANTIIIDRADMFGLGELYQLRGRVGRSSIQAYAYFLHDKRGKLTQESRDRLETMREAKGIGAGYMIAMRDLELRGAGDMLGPKQSGQVQTVGLDLYTRLLSREVGKLRAVRDGTAIPGPEIKPITIDLPLTVGLPESYVPDAMLRVQMYRRVGSLDSEAKIQAFEEELTDRFGKMPIAAQNLTFQARLKLLADKFGAQSITSEGNRFTVRADAIENLDQARLRLLVGPEGIIGRKQLSFLRSGTADQWKKKLMDIIERLAVLA